MVDAAMDGVRCALFSIGEKRGLIVLNQMIIPILF